MFGLLSLVWHERVNVIPALSMSVAREDTGYTFLTLVQLENQKKRRNRAQANS
jgi:hypothetical protein